MNRLRVLDAVREHGALTQVEIAAVTGLSPATVSNMVKELHLADAVVLTPSVRNGRRAVQVSLAAASGLLAAIVFGDRDVRVAIGTGGGEMIGHKRLPLPADHPGDEGISRASRLLHEVVEASGHSMPEVRAATVGLPAPIDTVSGQVGSDGILPRWRGVEVAGSMQEVLGVNVLLDNTANLAAVGESKHGALRDVRNGVFVKASYGIGAGLILGGELYRGSAGTAGEIGHVTIDEDGPLCRCGNRGCLDTFVGSEALLRALRPSHGDLSLRDVLKRALEGDPGCVRVLGDAGRHLGAAVANVVNLLNPEVVAVGGQLALVGDILLEPMRTAVERRAIPSAVHSLTIRIGELVPEDADVFGALALAEQVRQDADRAALSAG
jgi:predicted NBD/HSP70 family sugar kinase